MASMGTSGSAKIEGHVRFEQFFDLRPFLTENLQQSHSRMFCRLFAVVVHAGKNSHSGHYVAYVRNVGKNEWWKMDDAKVTRSGWNEVQHAEAYMLFYRVMDHPVAKALSKKQDAINKVKKDEEDRVRKIKEVEEAAIRVKKEAEEAKLSKGGASGAKRKREAPKYASGEEWAAVGVAPAAKVTRKGGPKKLLKTLQAAEEFVADAVEFKPDYFKLIMDEAKAVGSKVGGGPSEVSADDVQGGTAALRRALLDLMHKLATEGGGDDGSKFFLPSVVDAKKGGGAAEGITNPGKTLIVPAVDADEGLLL